MLNMNTKQGQSIFIGDDYELRLIDYNEDGIRVQLCKDGQWGQATCIGAGNTVTVIPNVKVTFRGIGSTGHSYAILGFEAPREISIIGDWKTGNRDSDPGANRAKLSQMSDTALLYYANMNAKTVLEHELLIRFKKRI